ncbi:hypothetical protein E9840_05595 [Tissierella creatinini]|nr:hypothetical protein E9840_05595 [Tissierella creatinini]TJX65301.1 hypothetical protein E8P77_10610 [Soehngenia saccharolytica]
MDELKMKESEDLHRTFFERLDSVFMVIEVLYDVDGSPIGYKYLKVNGLYEKHNGIKKERLFKGISNQAFPDLDYLWLKNCDEVVKTGESKHYTWLGENTKCWYDVFSFPYGDNKVGVQFRDITKEVETEQEMIKGKMHYKAYMAASFDNIFQLTPDFSQFSMIKVDDVLPEFYPNNIDLIKKYIYPDDLTYVLGEGDKGLQNKNIIDLKFRIFKEDGSLEWVHTRIVPIKNEEGDILEWIGASKYITDIKLGEEALKESERKSQELIRKLKKVDEQKNRFISTLSHEIRNPLASISMGLSLIDHLAPESEEYIRTRDILKHETYNLTRMVDDLLEVTRVKRNKIKIIKEDIEVNGTIKESLEAFLPKFKDKGVILEEEYSNYPIYIKADRVRIKQVIGNLLVNALKFTDKGGRVRITISKDEATKNLVINVSDTGIGMDPEFLEDLFEAFVQEDTSVDRSYGGLGLGLSIVKGIIDLHEGTIEAKSQGRGKGSEFIIRLPL